nr:YceI family protein [Methylibium sp. Root1272]
MALPVRAQTPVAKLLPAQSEIGFVSKQMGVPVQGQFKKFDAQVAFDPKKPETGKIAFAIDTGSATIGDRDTDAEMKKGDWFDTAKFPQATFQSSAIKSLGGGKFEVAGKLAIKGSSRDVLVPVTLTQAGGTSTATGAFAIKRLEFKIGAGDWGDTSMVADEVQVKFKLALTGVGAL